MTRKLAYTDALVHAVGRHLATFGTYPPKQLMGLG